MQNKPSSTKVLSETSKQEKNMESSKNEERNKESLSDYFPRVTEPTTRAELMKYWISLSLDKKTANKMLWISDGGSTVCRRTKEVCPVLDGPERYEYSPQVLCKESIWNSRAYWEVEYSGWVVIGATYEEAARRADSTPTGLGENEESWGLCWSGTRYEVWYSGGHKDINDVPFCSTIGVYIDQPAGIINFYTVTGAGEEREAEILHKVQTRIEKKILPGFWLGVQSSCSLVTRAE
ncbi:tripartite motif-containing protein 16-like protein [Nothobranchius furzeri]|uniref:Tripartite motif-containing protein 16-like protein n=1 Tax=Nothobranchius furzeri TaxID=105023 RepID=A0A8C6M9D7_NOTFU|nr:tripartite motif-containing protein 16-like protein [Nothobranchius furzeri]KAF7204548.1 tripartite motif-containing protein 16-like protein [Nothobranchius furzeri]